MVRQRSWLLIGLLGSLIACTPATPPAAPAGAAADGNAAAGSIAAGRGAADSPAERSGAELFNGNCSACHQPNGEGIPGVYPSLAGSPVVLGDPRALALWVVRGERPATMPPGRYSTAMPQFGWLEPADAAALLTYLRSSFGNHAPPVAAPTVAAALEGPGR